jgi:acetate kinase
MQQQKKYVLVLNCGSSSVKFAVIDPKSTEVFLSGIVQCIGLDNTSIRWSYQQGKKEERSLNSHEYSDAFVAVVSLIKKYALDDTILAVGHRVVHGGEKFTQSVLIDERVISAIRDCCRLAPLHNPANLSGIKAAQKAFPGLPQVVVFDTAFHQTLPEYAYLYPVSYELYKEHAVRRYGFHGTSHRFVTTQAAQILDLPLKDTAFISVHLGNGCSATAVLGGKSIDTTMGLTPLEGLVMGTRSGDVDPGLHSYLVDNLGYDIHKVTNLLNKQSGLLGISGKHADMREIEKAIQSGDKRAALAAEIFCYRLGKQIGALAIALKRVDALIFTGGIGENSDFIRAKTINNLAVLGVTLDTKRNNEHGKNHQGIITKPKSAICALVVPTNEELLIAQDTATIVGV